VPQPARGQATGAGTQTAQQQQQQQQQQQKPDQQQQPPATPPEEQPRVNLEVTVTAPRIDIPLKENPAATTVVTEETLEATMPRGIGAEEAFKLVPGMKVDNQADGERVHISIRGQGLLTETGIRGIKFLLDGLPLNDPSGFAPDLFDVDWSTIQRVEVLRGSASALYGGGSSGGVVNLTTDDGGRGPVAGNAEVTGGSYAFYKALAQAGGTAGNLNYRVSASHNAGDGYRVHTAFDATNLYGKFRWTLNERTKLTAIVAGTSFFNQNAEGLNTVWLQQDRTQANPDALTYNEYQKTRRATLGLVGQVGLATNQNLSFSVYYRHTNWTESVPSLVDHRTFNTPGAIVQYNLVSGSGPIKNHFTAGADLDWQGIDEYQHPNMGNAMEGPDLLADQKIAQQSAGVYFLDRIDFGANWGVMLDVRRDHIRNQLTDNLSAGGIDLSGEKTFDKTTGRIGMSWNPEARFGFYASWGQGFLPPSTNELSHNPDAFGGFNQHLVPATSQGPEFGIRGNVRNQFAYDIAFFHLATDSDFGRYRVPGRPLETFYGNLGTSSRNGFETLFGWYPTTDLAFRVAYTLSDFKYTKVQSLFGNFVNVTMPNAPAHQLYADAEYTISGHWVLGVGIEGQTKQYIDQTNLAWADGYALVHPRIAYRWKGNGYSGEVMFSARNLFGVEYIAFTEPDPDGNSYQPGPTRELFVGAKFSLGSR
jgi:iron complex outermembrane receptor protein